MADKIYQTEGGSEVGSSLKPMSEGYYLMTAEDILVPGDRSLADYINEGGGGSGGNGGGSSGGSGEGEYDGDTGYLDYTVTWKISDSPAYSNVTKTIRTPFVSNGQEFVGVNTAVLAVNYVRSDNSTVQVWSNRQGWTDINYKDITTSVKLDDDDAMKSWLDTNSIAILSGDPNGIIIRDPDRTANLPSIRFVGFSTDTGSFYAPNEWHFTIEVLGGGRLRLGDYFEICGMRTCKRPESDINAGYKRQRLRRLFCKVITDTSQKYITLVVNSDNDSQLFKNERNAVSTGNCRSNIYLRLKRPFLDEYGIENFAKFSNVICLEKSYSLNDRRISIK